MYEGKTAGGLIAGKMATMASGRELRIGDARLLGNWGQVRPFARRGCSMSLGDVVILREWLFRGISETPCAKGSRGTTPQVEKLRENGIGQRNLAADADV